MFGVARKLYRAGVLGINRRNAEYTLRYNARRLYPLVDDKLNTKKIAIAAGLAVPKLYGVIETQYQIRKLDAVLEQHADFAIKPSRGSGGNGILVISGRSKDLYRRISGMLMTRDELKYHASNILSGMYSLGGHPDRAMIEYRVKFDPVFEAISYLGVPDIRIIVFLGVPVMSMVRLPTRKSDGRANLHQGAIGAGIDIGTGTTLSAVSVNEIVTEHPDTGNKITGLKIPKWDTLLRLAAQCYELTGLGYVGVDIVLDEFEGPLILELNARPGLNIQIANRSGLLPRLKLIEKSREKIDGIEERVSFAKIHFSADQIEPVQILYPK
jgi:alpha-L-glutamate ligase-like protein